VDPAGAQSLRKRLEQQAHWQQAEAVRDGRQLPTDPDGDYLEELGDGIRIYSSGNRGSDFRRVCKRLVDGRWRHDVLRDPAEHCKSVTPVGRIASVQ
jgi:hypothetical protein